MSGYKCVITIPTRKSYSCKRNALTVFKKKLIAELRSRAVVVKKTKPATDEPRSSSMNSGHNHFDLDIRK